VDVRDHDNVSERACDYVRAHVYDHDHDHDYV
jgi:hypothetical protein